MILGVLMSPFLFVWWIGFSKNQAYARLGLCKSHLKSLGLAGANSR
jgi:hypothetical protein